MSDKLLSDNLQTLLDVEKALINIGDPTDPFIDWEESSVTMSASLLGCMCAMLLAYAAKYEGYKAHSAAEIYILQEAEKFALESYIN